jgi:serine/threonine protein kinase
MAIPVGTKLGTYEVTSHIGSGGMGEVYQAHDGKLGRDVAIKVLPLPEQFARDPERLARFQREAKMLAALNHPNIAAIYGLEQSGETHYLVMELVPMLLAEFTEALASVENVDFHREGCFCTANGLTPATPPVSVHARRHDLFFVLR